MKHQTSPVLVLVDVQKEYATPGRPFNLDGIAPSLANIARLLEHARRQAWTIIHVQHLQTDDKPVFNAESDFSRFIEGFEPRDGEWLLTKNTLSAFGGLESMLPIDARNVYLAGYGSPMCCAATILHAAGAGVPMRFVTDASWARATATRSESEMHACACDVLAIHSKLITTAEILNIDAKVAA